MECLLLRVGARAAVVVCLLLATNWPEQAHAEAPDAEAVAKEAREHVELGVLYYDANRFAEAAAEFEAAHKLSGRPALFFNIARAKAKLGLEEDAIAYLERYVAARPDAADASSVRAEIEARKRALVEVAAKRKAEADVIAARRAAEETEQRAMIARAEQQAAEAKQREQRRLFRRNLGIDLLIGGGLVAIAGVGFGGAAISDARTVSHASGEFDGASCCVAIERRGKTFAAVGITFDVIGLATAVTGATLLGMHAKPERSKPVAQVTR